MSDKWYTPAGKSYDLYKNMLEQHHLLIAGACGSGKSVVINALIYHAMRKAPQDAPGCCQLILCDPKRVELVRYKNLPHVLRFANSLETIAEALAHAHNIMMARYADMEKRGLVEYDRGDLYVIVDEFADLILHNSDREANRIRTQVENMIQSLAQMGRAAHVHLILATQAPNRKTIKPNIVLNMTARLALRCESPIESKQIINQPGAELLPDPRVEHRAHGLYKTGFTVEEWNLPMTPPEDIAERIAWWTKQVEPAPTFGFLRRLFKAS